MSAEHSLVSALKLRQRVGSDADWQSLYIDMRKYISLTTKKQQNVIAFWAYYWKTFGNGIPYLNLPSIGWDPYQRSGRGIDTSDRTKSRTTHNNIFSASGQNQQTTYIRKKSR